MPFLLSFDIPLICEERLESIEHCNHRYDRQGFL